MKVTQDLLFIGCSKYDFTDEATGRVIKGCKVDLVSPDNRKGENVHGYEAVTVSAPFELFYDLYKLSPLKPYQFELEMQITKKGTKSTILSVSEKTKVQ